MKMLILVLLMVFIVEEPAHAGIYDTMHQVFGYGGEGWVLTLITTIGVGSWALCAILDILQLGTIKNWVKAGAIIVALSIFITKALSVIDKIWSKVVG